MNYGEHIELAKERVIWFAENGYPHLSLCAARTLAVLRKNQRRNNRHG